MPSSLKLLSTSISGVIALGFLTIAAQKTQALTWNGGTGTWDNVASNHAWDGGTSGWVAGSTAVFSTTGSGTVTIGDNLTISAIDFSTTGSGPFTFQNDGNTIDITGAGITSISSNTQIITGSGINAATGKINFRNSASAGDSSITINSAGAVNFLDTSKPGAAAITNAGTLRYGNTVDASTASGPITNGGTFDVSGTTFDPDTLITTYGSTGVVKTGNLTNTSDGLAGQIFVGKKTLTVGNFTLDSDPVNDGHNIIDFTLNAPGSSGSIVIGANKAFTGFAMDGLVGGTDITLSSSGAVTPGTYTLIDWSAAGATATGINVNDFNLVGPLPGGLLLPQSHLVINGSQLQLVAVPEPSTMMMPLVAALGMVWLRRRAARMAV